MNPFNQTNPQLEILYEVPLLRGRFVVFNSMPDFELLHLKQTHSTIIINENQWAVGIEADGIVGSSQTPKAILTADCLPIIILGQKEHIVIHAGWRGLANGILNQKILFEVSPIYAFIGPHIRQMHYEVQKDFINHFPQYSTAFKNINSKIFFDLAAVASAELKKLSPAIEIVDCGLCTFSNHNFSSYRRNHTIHRNWNIYIPL